jgi:hypothetical protein
MTTTWLRTGTGLAAALLLAAGCHPAATGTASPATAPASSRPAPASGQPGTPSASRPPAPAAAPSSPGWSSGPVAVVHEPPVPPVPVVTGIRYAAHPDRGYDRVVFDIDGELPGYAARYVAEVRADPSDRPVSVPGRRHLLIVLQPAQAHRADGAPTVGGVHRTGLPMLESYAVMGDFEGHVSIALGLDDVAGYRIGELPGRIYVDIAA